MRSRRRGRSNQQLQKSEKAAVLFFRDKKLIANCLNKVPFALINGIPMDTRGIFPLKKSK